MRVILLLYFLAWGFTSRGQDHVKVSEKLNHLVGLYMDSTSENIVSGLSVQVTNLNTEQTWKICKGYSNVTDKIIFTNNSAFRIASVSKTLTAVIVMQMVENGLIGLNDPISKFLDKKLVDSLHIYNGKSHGDSITIMHLLRHSSGLPDYASDPDFLIFVFGHPDYSWNVDKIWDYYFSRQFNRRALFAPCDTMSNYSDANYVLLGMIVEKISCQSLSRNYRQGIFNKCGMQNAYLEYYEPPVIKGKVADIFLGKENIAHLNTAFDWGAGGLVMNNDELQSFALALFSRRLFKNKESLDKMFDFIDIPRSNAEYYGYGIGLAKIKLQGKPLIIGHSGFFKTFIAWIPEYHLVISGTLNQVNADFYRLVFEIADIFKQKSKP